MLILPLDERHDRSAFDCGDADLNRWFAQLARQHKDKGISSTFVAVEVADGMQVFGYYAISVAGLINAELPQKHVKRLPRKVPVFRLGRLAVGNGHKGRRIGEFLLFEAIDRVKRIAVEVGGVGLVVNAKPAAVGFYGQYGFEQMADHPSNLLLPL